MSGRSDRPRRTPSSKPVAAREHPFAPWSFPRERTIRGAARLFAREHKLHARYRELDRRPAFPYREYRALGERGWLAPRAPARDGGSHWSILQEAALIEELAFEGGSVFAKLVLQPEFCSALLHGSPALRARWYRPLLAGKALVGNQITEPGCGSDAAALITVAERDGDHYVLSGTKSEIAFAGEAEAAIVYARTGPEEGSHGISALLVPQGLRGITKETYDDLGERWMVRGTVHYDRVRIPCAQRIGEEGQGFRYLMEELTPERALLGALYLAIARASWNDTVEHVVRREAFGRPVGAFQGVSFPLVEDFARLESARLWVWQVLRRLHQGRATPSEGALAKWLANTTALEVLDHAMQFHGGAGYSARLPHEQRWRDVRSGTAAHGTNEILRVVAARELIPARSVR